MSSPTSLDSRDPHVESNKFGLDPHVESKLVGLDMGVSCSASKILLLIFSNLNLIIVVQTFQSRRVNFLPGLECNLSLEN